MNTYYVSGIAEGILSFYCECEHCKGHNEKIKQVVDNWEVFEISFDAAVKDVEQNQLFREGEFTRWLVEPVEGDLPEEYYMKDIKAPMLFKEEWSLLKK